LLEIESLSQPWGGVPDIETKLDEALKLYGRGSYMGTTQSIEGFGAEVGARSAEGVKPACEESSGTNSSSGSRKQWSIGK